MLAAPHGFGSNQANSSATGRPRAEATAASAASAGMGGTSSRHQAKAPTHSSGRTPWAVATLWPTFT
jgi:hypothetical protein